MTVKFPDSSKQFQTDRLAAAQTETHRNTDRLTDRQKQIETQTDRQTASEIAVNSLHYGHSTNNTITDCEIS